MLRKGLAVALVLLFIGVAFAPGVNANISKASIDSELVEITTEICGLNGGKYTVQLTKEEAEEVEHLFDSIRERLNATETREKTVEIFKEAVVELDKYGLLGDLSVKQAQRLVIGQEQNPEVVECLERWYSRNQGSLDYYGNILCLIEGFTDNTAFQGPLARMRYLFYELLMEMFHYYDIIVMVLSTWTILRMLIWNFNPLPFGYEIGLGRTWEDPAGLFHYYPANGWIHTNGLMGKKEWDGSFYGQLPRFPPFSPFPIKQSLYLPGVLGFTGIHITDIDAHYYLGSALLVKLDSEP